MKTAGEVLGDHGPVEETPGQIFFQAISDTFEGGGWAEALEWCDLNERQKARWERAAARYAEISQPTKEGEGK